jgi:DNA-binding transcriptional regulator YhcF (GntR family)
LVLRYISLMITVDATSAVPPFEQVRSQLAHQVATGELVVGTRLPTVRRLAADLGLAVNTVARAYRELEQSGLIETRGRAGTFVSASGDHSRERARDAARAYAAVVTEVGLDVEEAMNIVRAALARALTGRV